MQKYYSNIISSSGKPVAGASVLVVNYPANTTATIYSDNGITTTTNPIIADAFGQFSFYAANGRYGLSVTASGLTGFSFPDFILDDSQSSLTYTDTGIVASFASTVAGYNQIILQNKSAASNASTNLNISNDAATATTNFAEFGINSSTYSGTSSLNLAGAAYLATASTDLVIGTYAAKAIHFVVASNANDAAQVTTSNIFTVAPISVPAGGSASARLGLSSSATLGVYFGSGVPTVSAAQGSLYMRTDGSSSSTRMYINTNGSTTWTNVTTAA